MASDKSASELRQQGAIQTGQEANQTDPEIQPEAVEKVLVNETEKAGAHAYQFDPDASPEEKAAAAEAVCPPGIVCIRLPADFVAPTSEFPPSTQAERRRGRQR